VQNTTDRARALSLIVETLRNASTDTAEVAAALPGATDARLEVQARVLDRLSEELAEAAVMVREAARP
jgi:hypothetical protein